MRIEKLSKKQKRLMKWAFMPSTRERYKAIVCDGAVRSGKTICMVTAFILWAMRYFDGQSFGICGKTVASAERNIIVPAQEIDDLTAFFQLRYRKSDHVLVVSGNGRENRFYVFGGKDESSYALVQGITLAGVLLDEVALMPKSFVDQAIARTLSIPASKLWFNCNPESPGHWFFKEWVQQPEEKNALHLHFRMEDNPIMTPEAIADAERMYSGVFYQRYILGLWVAAEGVIYKEFAESIGPGGDGRFLWPKERKLQLFRVHIGVDFGGNGSKHAFVATGVLPGYAGAVVLRARRVEPDTPNALNEAFVDFCADVFQTFGHIDAAYCDNAEQVLIRGMIGHCQASSMPWLASRIRNAAKIEIIDRIRLVSTMMGSGRFWYLPEAASAKEALANALWSQKHPGKDERLDDGSTDVDTLDALEYTLERDYKRYLKARGYV